VLPANAIIEGIEAVDRSDGPDGETGDESVMQAALGAANQPDRTLGFRYKEMHLPLDVDVYVLGVVGENRCIGAPAAEAKGQRFLISVKSEEARAAELGSASTWMLGLGAACLLGAVISLGSAVWLARERLNEVAPPQEVLQGERFW
jgi:E3 Ubiquitin ligase